MAGYSACNLYESGPSLSGSTQSGPAQSGPKSGPSESGPSESHLLCLIFLYVVVPYLVFLHWSFCISSP